jgi:hypothetical protein
MAPQASVPVQRALLGDLDEVFARTAAIAGQRDPVSRRTSAGS